MEVIWFGTFIWGHSFLGWVTLIKMGESVYFWKDVGGDIGVSTVAGCKLDNFSEVM